MTKAPLLLKTLEQTFMWFHNPLVFRFCGVEESPESPPGVALNNSLPEWILLNLCCQSIASHSKSARPLKLAWIYTQDQTLRQLEFNETSEINSSRAFILHRRKSKTQGGDMVCLESPINDKAAVIIHAPHSQAWERSTLWSYCVYVLDKNHCY